MTNPVVSVCMVTYNHEKYIVQAIESVLNQQTTFDVELIIGEDCSSDTTRTICEAYAKQHPEKIRLLAHPKNLGMMGNFITVLNACRAKYIATLDGDDYWTDPFKLQKQVDFMNTNSAVVLCYHKTDLLLEETNSIKKAKAGPVNVFGGLSLFNKSFPTLTVLFSNVIKEYPPEMLKTPIGDKFLWALVAEHGLFADLGFVGSVYRKHSYGEWSGINPLKRHWRVIQTRFLVYDVIKNETKKLLKPAIASRSKTGLFLALRRLNVSYSLRFSYAILKCFLIR
jgi:glycosyltransferase involved in cell wall biosynthesis